MLTPKISLLVFLFLAIATTASANCNDVRCVDKIDKLYMSSNQNLYISTESDETQLDCQLADGRYITLRKTDSLFSQFFNMLLTAKAAGLVVNLRIRTGTDGCALNYIVLE